MTAPSPDSRPGEVSCRYPGRPHRPAGTPCGRPAVGSPVSPAANLRRRPSRASCCYPAGRTPAAGLPGGQRTVARAAGCATAGCGPQAGARCRYRPAVSVPAHGPPGRRITGTPAEPAGQPRPDGAAVEGRARQSSGRPARKRGRQAAAAHRRTPVRPEPHPLLLAVINERAPFRRRPPGSARPPGPAGATVRDRSPTARARPGRPQDGGPGAYRPPRSGGRR